MVCACSPSDTASNVCVCVQNETCHWMGAELVLRAAYGMCITRRCMGEQESESEYLQKHLCNKYKGRGSLTFFVYLIWFHKLFDQDRKRGAGRGSRPLSVFYG